MADVVKHGDWGLLLGTTSVPFEKGSLSVVNRETREEIQSGSKLRADLIQVTRKHPVIQATLFDPGLVTAWDYYASGETYTQVMAAWRSYEQNGEFGTAYVSFLSAKGIIVPISLTASLDTQAKLQIEAHPIFTGGTGVAVGTTAIAGPASTQAYFATSIQIASESAITEVVEMTQQWEYEINDDNQLEAAYYYYPRFAMSGTARVKDVSAATAARFEDTTAEAITLVFTDANAVGSPVTVTNGTCKVKVEMSGEDAVITWTKVGNT